MEEKTHPLSLFYIKGEQGIGQFVDSMIQILVSDPLPIDDKGRPVGEIMSAPGDEIAGIQMKNPPDSEGTVPGFKKLSLEDPDGGDAFLTGPIFSSILYPPGVSELRPLKIPETSGIHSVTFTSPLIYCTISRTSAPGGKIRFTPIA
jgi:hypothetical protein